MVGAISKGVASGVNSALVSYCWWAVRVNGFGSGDDYESLKRRDLLFSLLWEA